MSKIFTAKFHDEMKKHNLLSEIPDLAISNNRIVKVEDRKVFFKYKKPKSNRW